MEEEPSLLFHFIASFLWTSMVGTFGYTLIFNILPHYIKIVKEPWSIEWCIAGGLFLGFFTALFDTWYERRRRRKAKQSK